jgi:hypothetical protein
VLKAMRAQCQRTNIRCFAKLVNLDEANLAHILDGRHKPSQMMLVKLEATLARSGPLV